MIETPAMKELKRSQQVSEWLMQLVLTAHTYKSMKSVTMTTVVEMAGKPSKMVNHQRDFRGNIASFLSAYYQMHLPATAFENKLIMR